MAPYCTGPLHDPGLGLPLLQDSGWPVPSPSMLAVDTPVTPPWATLLLSVARVGAVAMRRRRATQAHENLR